MTSIDDFAIAVRGFCDWAELAASATTAKSEMLLARRHLSTLYAMAANLPECECEWVDSTLTRNDWTVTFKRFGQLPVGYYGTICNPLEVPAAESALGDLADDLADIWRDLKKGLFLFDAGDRAAAASQWQESFTIHWGDHAANALAVVHFWIGQNRYTD
ncbi:DUF5063 domain-containing protein [Massilia sp. CF038]|uniref:DUF5063 domain-containing protein n=1 Tax=Massilia sp. CF038 TaxID=1881045 RepID=UPI00091DE27F|nr:DUF5063 domain-containing protein [Massilia sp. CF038]SHG60966.1 protein of unknown function [Massilia sp. CF038]